MKKIILSIDGMTCSACSNGLEKYLNKQKGIINASVNLVMANALVEYDEAILNQKKIEEFIKQAGFKSLGIFHEVNEEKHEKSEKNLFIIFLLLAILMMYISMGHMIGLPTLDILNMHINPRNYMITLLVLTIAFVIYGWDIIKNGYKNLIHATPNMDTLVGIGVSSSILYSIYSMCMVFAGNNSYIEHLYFESAAIVIFFIKLGRYIDKVSKGKTKDAIQKLVKITPSGAVILKNGQEKQVTIDEIEKGDIVICKPGEKIAVDGEIIKGQAHLDEAFITGESKPSLKTVGAKVIAGSINYDGYLEYTAQKIGKESTISEIVRLVLEATNTKAPIAKVADKVSGYFVPAVMLIAILTLIAYLILGYDLGVAVNVFVTILVVACPCSLGLATPLAIVVSQGMCAGKGILVKTSEILENAQKTNMAVFDKTGTLTYGVLKISEIKKYKNIPDNELLAQVSSLESKTSHPIGKAFLEYAKENNINLYDVQNFEEISGLGIKGKIQNDELYLGNAKLIEKQGIQNTHLDDGKELASKGNSIVYVVKNQEIIAIIGVNDMIRQNAKEVIKSLKEKKIETMMLTGDNQETAENIAKELGITHIVANVLPNQKVEKVKEMKEKYSHIMMCGDGINDSPALASSDIGVSVSSGTDIAIDSADVILTKNDLNGILELVNISKRTIRNIKQNLFWAFFYNSLMIPIAMGILKPIGISINPMIASLAMVLSSITVIFNSLRLKNN